jgi:hypothetical protein
MTLESCPILVTPVRGPAYFWQLRNWGNELVEFLEKEPLSADPRLTSGRIKRYKQFVNSGSAHRALAAARVEAAGWPERGCL